MLKVKLYDLKTSPDSNRFKLIVSKGSRIEGLRLTSYDARPKVAVLERTTIKKRKTRHFILATMGVPFDFDGEMEDLILRGSCRCLQLYEIKK